MLLTTLTACSWNKAVLVGGVNDFVLLPKGTTIPVTVPGNEKPTVMTTEREGAWMSMEAINRTLKAR